MRTLPSLLLIVVLPTCGGNNKPPDNPLKSDEGGTPSVPDPLVELNKTIQDPKWDKLMNPLEDTEPIPQTGSVTYDPAQALGTLWALQAIDETKKCSEVIDHPDMIRIRALGRFQESDPAKCKIKIEPPHRMYSFRLTEKAAASVKVGTYMDAKAEGSRAFEITIERPAVASFEDETACFPLETIKQLQIDPSKHFCAMRWSKAAVLTTITYRSFQKFDANVKSAFVIVNVEGDLYSSTEELKETPILSGNYRDLVADLPTDPTTGAIDLSGNKAAKPPRVLTAAEVQAAKLTWSAIKKRDVKAVENSAFTKLTKPASPFRHNWDDFVLKPASASQNCVIDCASRIAPQ